MVEVFISGMGIDAGDGSGSDWCWYSKLRKCPPHIHSFDSSDHIVLYVCQYMVPLSIEVSVVLQYVSARSSPYIYNLRYCKAGVINADWKLMVFGFLMVLVMCLLLRGMYYTCSYFHTAPESICALVQSIVLLVLPLYMYSHHDKDGFVRHVMGLGRD